MTTPSGPSSPTQGSAANAVSGFFSKLGGMFPASAVLSQVGSYLGGSTIQGLFKGESSMGTLASAAYNLGSRVVGGMSDSQFMSTYYGGASHSPNNPFAVAANTPASPAPAAPAAAAPAVTQRSAALDTPFPSAPKGPLA